MTGTAEPDLEVEVLLEDDRWEPFDLPGLATKAAGATLEELSLSGPFEISLLGCNDARIAALNSEFRGKPAPTNVLSWPAEYLSAQAPGAAPEAPTDSELGDIALAFETVLREAQAEDRPPEHHILHLLVHGTLHLLGFDHEIDADAVLMERIEVAALARLGVPDPY